MPTSVKIRPHRAPPASRSKTYSDVVVVGAGIVGLTNALQLAKRGLDVTLVDNVASRKDSYKVGESFLVFTSAFLRTVGELDRFISEESFIKLGVWFTVGAEHRTEFSGTTEWAVNADPHPPHYLFDHAPDKKWFRCMFLDMQIARPDAEAAMRDAVRRHPNIRFLDDVFVESIALSETDAPHCLTLAGTRDEPPLEAGWIMDCSGRNRLLARQLDHRAERRERDDEFQTSAAWGQFSHVDDAKFGEQWSALLASGQRTPRDLYTVHLWGVGYWIWVIRLSQNRISVGVTFDLRRTPAEGTLREQFWALIGRHPVLHGIIGEETLLEFQAYRQVQHWTDRFVSAKRYAMAGDAGSIIDAYYSQGIALALVSSWHIANVMERQVKTGEADHDYIDRINEATRQDWAMMRNMVREKYTPAIEDSRFFLLSHILDMAIFWCMGRTRAKLTHWLVRTEGYSDRQTPELERLRRNVERRLFYSRSPYWLGLSPERVQRLQRYLQRKIAERARWRQEHGIVPPPLKSVLSVTAPLPRIWRLPFARNGKVLDISARDLVQPAAQRADGTATWFDHLPIPINTKLDWVIRLRPLGLLASFAFGYVYDALDTTRRKIATRSSPTAAGTSSPLTSDLPNRAGGSHA
ncbi:FAD-dependent oxidoreductase [Methylobacterium indicum]|uniref:NAD(P)/FAD-dependent oxidoreductase n=1 Tax=Methylobacterium indicum TaxID=1775910 RepID=UPI0007965325|nr:FAD-dependent oxidoreductase [Methylobacterium indicum]KTS31417.1 FAD-dependent oxidoreductase [Methylobacterium indicum]KTS42061.1 FAD-dependent oxidoreductase [Methylobacterium indicum]KTS50072.1 FAD-dependent oxidoreductase [Methylobacterium indicum]